MSEETLHLTEGPHGLNRIKFYPHNEPRPPFTVHSYWLGSREGIVEYELEVVSAKYPDNLLHITALCVHVEGDDATHEAATQWLLDLTNARYG